MSKQAQDDTNPEAAKQGASNRLTATMISLAALAILGAATANSLPSFSLPGFSLPSFSLPSFERVSLPKFDWPSWASFNRNAAPKTSRLAALPPPRLAAAPMPDPAVYAALTDIQFSQGQNATTLAALTENSATQQADLKRISRQLLTLSAQVSALHSARDPVTTSSIAPFNPRARIIRASRKTAAAPQPPPIPKPVGPVSVGGAPLTPPAPAARSGV